MAEKSTHDVVNQPQSVDALSSTDVSATTTIDPAARAAVVNQHALDTNKSMPATVPAPDHTENRESGISDEGDGSLGIPKDNTIMSDVEQNTNGILHNSDNRDFESNEDGSIRSAGVDGSMGSDTDTSRNDAAGNTGKDADGRDQVPRYAVKKSSFKPVSVSKTFLAKAGNSTTLVKSSSDKVAAMTGSSTSTLTQTTARPRLVAKSVSSSRSSTPKTLAMGNKMGKGTGPDPNQVWNRNRVSTPQATPKHLTDEELRQQYGIQLASRPQDDGDGKEAKWADIDDDEDDWAPETIEWSDGTKINLAPIEASLLSQEQPAVNAAKEEPEMEAETSKTQTPVSKVTTVGPNATVLKLGSAVQPKSGLVLKSSSEKATLVAKPSVSTPVKSPWASLPAVEKVSPVPINPTQNVQPNFGQKDVHGFDAMPPPPTKEIAADDFSRFSRETPSSMPKELYNSQSGRYEPVNESRRQPARKDQNFRQPSVLQRPPPADHGPAEPSPAFQTHRSQYEAAPWARRRTSSNVSGESGRFGRRMSIGKGFDGPQQRRDSQYEQSPFAPIVHPSKPGQREASPAQSQSISSQSPTTQNIPATPNFPPPASHDQSVLLSTLGEDPVSVQKRLMREKREAAIKRKQEEEAREEAERRERIRLKMEKLGLTDEKMGFKKPTTMEPVAPPKVLQKDSKENHPSIPQSPPKPPVPNSSGQPQQYGLMKVHAPQILHLQPTSPALVEKRAANVVNQTAEPKTKAPVEVMPSYTGESEPHVRLGDEGIIRNPQEVNKGQAEPQIREVNIDSRQNVWNKVQQVPDGYASWSTGNLHARSGHVANPWGAPVMNKGLGNGDFQNNLQQHNQPPPRPQPNFPPHILSPLPPQPIGTPRQHPHSVTAIHLNKPADLLPRSAEDPQTVPAFPSEPTPTPPSLNRQQPNISASGEQSRVAGSATTSHTMTSTLTVEQQARGVAAWANFNAQADDKARYDLAVQNANVRKAELRLQGGRAAIFTPAISEQWVQVKRNGNVTQKLQTIESHDALLGAGKETAAVNMDNPAKPATTNHVSAAPPQVRSRYQDIFDQSERAMATQPELPACPGPDGPEHPVNSTAGGRIIVNLPGSPKSKFTEKPIVKLPPAKTSPPSPQATTDARGPIVPARGAAQPLVTNPSWQDRFNGLFDRKTPNHPTEKKFSDTVDSTSKVPLELATVGHSTSVALPPQEEGAGKDLPTKTIEEVDALFEERDFGSVPTVRLPTKAPAHAWNPHSEPSVPYKVAKSMALDDYDVLSIKSFAPGLEDVNRATGVPVRAFLPGMVSPSVKIMPHSAGSIRFRNGNAKPPRGHPRHKAKDHNTGSASNHNTSGGSNAQNGGNPKNRSKGNGNNHNGSTWARRVSGIKQ